ncbi:glycosyltransferase family 4 protein [Paenibacillus filicis]|uniref:Glycosyltransferase family 4 protein n=1 Tax=Paenibacillus gyeongsangnamensis TaxID=3388067 RepID=A0ABT4Q610_9BACL|nr:glycosyltransferase family 4 protein [Paenibacillus filicis]MCZ8512241.1 glycosyltransferase family 4 protein [Paenibacillus filicis]
MKILMVAPEQIPVPGNGSVEICMLSIAKKLAKTNKVTLVSRKSSGLPPASKLGNLTIIRVPTGSSGKYIASVLRYIKGKKYDLIQVDNRPHYMAKVKKAFPHTPVSLFLHSLTFVPRTRAVSASMSRADLIIANSDSLKSTLSSWFPAVESRIHRVHLGVDTARFKPSKSSGRSRSFHVLFAGRVIPRKGVPVIIKAMGIVRSKIRHAKLTIAGGGKSGYVKSLKALARRHRIPARFSGKIPHRSIHKLYRKADCFVCPSQQHEAFGLVNVEAMASGLPVVASNIGGIKEIINAGSNGYLVDRYKSPKAHAKYLMKLAQDPEHAALLGKQARSDAVRRFSWKQTASKLESIYVSK